MSAKTKIDKAIELAEYELNKISEEITIREAQGTILRKHLEQLRMIKEQGTAKK